MFSSQNSQVSSAANYIEDVFSTYLYTGNGSTQTITNGIDLAGKGGMVWTKNRNATQGNAVFDTARGNTKYLLTQTTDAQQTSTDDITGFLSTGYTLGNNATTGNTNYSAYTYASWTFRKQPKFFDVVTFTRQTGGGAQTVSHNLGSVPGCIICKSASDTSNWVVYHRGLSNPNTKVLQLNTTSAEISDSVFPSGPTSTTFTIDTFNEGVTVVAYIFAHNAGGFGLTGTDNVISCGSWTGANTLVNLGWEPQWILSKRIDSATVGAWEIADNMRGMPARPSSENYLLANTSAAEVSGGYNFTLPTSTGFYTDTTASGTYIYIAIRRGPMKVPTDATKVMAPVAYSGDNTNYRAIQSGFTSDLFVYQSRNTTGSGDGAWFDRLRGGDNYLITRGTRGTDSEAAFSIYTQSDTNNGWKTGDYAGAGNINSSGTNLIAWMFRRAPNFFDEVCYTGTGSATTVTHNLGVAPEMMIVKGRSNAYNWGVYAASQGNAKGANLNQTSAFSSSGEWNSTTPTSSVFSLGAAATVNDSGATYVAYLFASCPGVSKVGTYAGNGSSQTINCGFAAGARFVLIKRTDGGGSWLVWDTARGINPSGTADPYLALNSTAAETTGNDYVDPNSSGFVVKGAGINNTGETYIYLAIA